MIKVRRRKTGEVVDAFQITQEILEGKASSHGLLRNDFGRFAVLNLGELHEGDWVVIERGKQTGLIPAIFECDYERYEGIDNGT